MAQQLSQNQAAQLAELLEANAQRADDEGDAAERNTFNAAAAKLRAWLRDGGPQPPDAGRYAGLLDGVGEAAPPAAETPAVPEMPVVAEPPVMAEPPAPEPLVMEPAAPPTAEVNDNGASLFGPAPVEDEVPAEVPPETAEAYEARRELDAARRALEELAPGDVGGLNVLRDTVNRLLARSGRSPEGEALAAEIATRVNRAIEEARARGDDYRAAGDSDAARRQYDIVLQLDPEDGRAREARQAVDRAAVAQMGDADRARLQRDLRERGNQRVLEAAVRDAEILEYEGRLTPDLIKLLREARAAFDAKRRQQGEMTTFARFGDLAARRQAVENIMQQVIAGDKVIFDAGRNEHVESGQALEEAQRFYREKSEDLANYELSHVNRMLPGHPAAALAHLQEVMATRPAEKGEAGVQYVRHFQPDTVARLLAPRADELKQMVDAQERAAAKVAEADAATDEMAALRLLLEAEGLYPGLIGLKTRLELARNAAVARLAQGMEAQHNTARAALAEERFDEAATALNEADKLPGGWPEEAKPAALEALKVKSDELRETVKKDRKRRADFNRLDARIRADLLDPDKRGEAMDLYKEVLTKYAALESDIAELNSFVNQHKGTGEQLADLRGYIQAEKWAEAKELAETIQRSGKAGDAADEVETHLNQATQEVNIAAALEHLEARRVPEARKLLAAVYRGATPDGKKVLEERLEEAFKTVKAAMEEQSMEPLYQRAVELAKRPAPKEQLAALRLLRHVAGEPGETPEPHWPAYALSKHTAESRDKAAELRKNLREALLPGIKTAASRVREQKAAGNDSLVAAAADNARLLREAALLDTAEEKGAADDLALFQGRIDAKGKEAIGDWDGAVELWERLDHDHSRLVAADLRRARIEQAVRAADRLIRADQADEAQTTLRRALSAPEIGEAPELYLKQADAYAAQGDFDAAAAVLRYVEDRLPDAAQEVGKKQTALQREQGILNALSKAETERDGGRYRDAMTTLNNALQNALLSDSRRLKQLRKAVYDRGSEFLLGEADKALAEASQDSKTQAVVRLAELDEIEQLAGIPAAQRVAPGRLQPLKDELYPSIDSTLRQAEAFNPAGDRLDRAIEKATDLSKRLQTFRQVAPALSVELGVLTNRLAQEGPRLSGLVSQLLRLRELLRDVDDSSPANDAAHQLWDDAIRTGKFDQLEIQRRQIKETGLDASPDALAFQQRLDEWEEIRETLLERIQDITANFTSGAQYPAAGDEPAEMAENFGGVLQLLLPLSQRPARRKDGVSPWAQLDQAAYARVYDLMGDLLVIPDQYERNELRGWEHVREAAAIRLKEVNAWTTWEYAYTQHMTLAGTRSSEAQTLPPTTPRVQRRDAWLAVDAALEEAQKALAEPVTLDGDPVAVRTRWAQLVDRRADANRRLAAQWRDYVKNQLPGEATLVFPSAADFDQATKLGRDALAAKLAEAEQIGPSDDAERRRLTHYRDKVLPTLGVAAPKKPSLREWLRNR